MVVVDHGNNIVVELNEISCGFFAPNVLSMIPYAEQVAIDTQTNSFFVTSKQGHLIVQLYQDQNKSVTKTIAGNGTAMHTDGVGAFATFTWPEAILVLDSDTLIVSDSGNNAIRKLVKQGSEWSVSTIAGTGKEFFSDGFGTNAAFHFPKGMIVSPKQYTPEGTTHIFVVDYRFCSKFSI